LILIGTCMPLQLGYTSTTLILIYFTGLARMASPLYNIGKLIVVMLPIITDKPLLALGWQAIGQFRRYSCCCHRHWDGQPALVKFRVWNSYRIGCATLYIEL
jgi:hypothetical protein